MITKLFANGQVWELWDKTDKGVNYINTKGTHVADVSSLELFDDFEVLHPPQRTETPAPQEISSKQGDCIADLVHLLCVELQLMYSYLPESQEFIVLYKNNIFKLTTPEDIGKLRHMINLMEELSCE